MGFYEQYKPVFDGVKTSLETISGLKVLVGEPFNFAYDSFPLALVDPIPTTFEEGEIGRAKRTMIGIRVIIIVRTEEPSNWFDDIITKMSEAYDALLSDQTLDGTVMKVDPVDFYPGEITMGSKIYYGGVIEVEAFKFTTPI